ncbi:hypothetical protein ABZR88_07895 [Mucilaginibacter yixingensis]|nr:hypothetical protein [Mucilaginibacter yixingensis]
MNKLLSLLLGLVIFSNTLLAQTKTNKVPKKPHTIQWLDARYRSSYDDCTYTKKYSLAQRLNKYPFNKAVKILAVSYPLVVPPHEIWKTMADGSKILAKDTTNRKEGLIIAHDTLDRSTLIETKEINQSQINGLTELIYNTNWRNPSFPYHVEGHGGCYDPRNAVVFIDKDGKVIDYIQICFHCMESHSMNDDRLSIGTLCNQKYDLMKKWFINLGITYGTIKTEKDL